MSAVDAREITEEQFLDLVAKIAASVGTLSSVGAGLLAALHLGICSDSRTFSRLFDIAHALVLREVTELADGQGVIAIVDRNARTQRAVVALTDASRDLLARVASTDPARPPEQLEH